MSNRGSVCMRHDDGMIEMEIYETANPSNTIACHFFQREDNPAAYDALLDRLELEEEADALDDYLDALWLEGSPA